MGVAGMAAGGDGRDGPRTGTGRASVRSNPFDDFDDFDDPPTRGGRAGVRGGAAGGAGGGARAAGRAPSADRTGAVYRTGDIRGGTGEIRTGTGDMRGGGPTGGVYGGRRDSAVAGDGGRLDADGDQRGYDRRR